MGYLEIAAGVSHERGRERERPTDLEALICQLKDITNKVQALAAREYNVGIRVCMCEICRRQLNKTWQSRISKLQQNITNGTVSSSRACLCTKQHSEDKKIKIKLQSAPNCPCQDGTSIGRKGKKKQKKEKRKQKSKKG